MYLNIKYLFIQSNPVFSSLILISVMPITFSSKDIRKLLLCLLHFLRGQALLPSKKIHHPYYTQNRVLEWCSGFSVSVIIPADSYCQHVVLCHGLQKNLGLLMFTGAA